MVEHIVMWNVMDEFKDDKEAVCRQVKESLEALDHEVPGIISINVVINDMQSSNKDIALISRFESVEALNAYQVSDGHVKAGKYVKSHLCDRSCLDYQF